MKKKFKDTKTAKILGKILNGVIDLLPAGTTVSTIVKDLASKKLDRNNDGKISLEDFKPIELGAIIIGLIVLSYLASKGVIDIEVLRQVAFILGF